MPLRTKVLGRVIGEIPDGQRIAIIHKVGAGIIWGNLKKLALIVTKQDDRLVRIGVVIIVAAAIGDNRNPALRVVADDLNIHRWQDEPDAGNCQDSQKKKQDEKLHSQHPCASRGSHLRCAICGQRARLGVGAKNSLLMLLIVYSLSEHMYKGIYYALCLLSVNAV